MFWLPFLLRFDDMAAPLREKTGAWGHNLNFDSIFWCMCSRSCFNCGSNVGRKTGKFDHKAKVIWCPHFWAFPSGCNYEQMAAKMPSHTAIEMNWKKIWDEINELVEFIFKWRLSEIRHLIKVWIYIGLYPFLAIVIQRTPLGTKRGLIMVMGQQESQKKVSYN